MKHVFMLLMLAFSLFSVQSAFAFNNFFCQCQAKAPGYEETNRETGGIDKICSYSCNCVAWQAEKDKNGKYIAKSAVPNIRVNADKLPTTATSREEWDHGSHVCHGQYSYRPRLSDPNWKIEVKFDTFGINPEGDVIYPEDASRQIAQGINYVGFKYSKKAKEIAASIAKQLKDKK